MRPPHPSLVTMISPLQMGVEMELWVVDDDGRLADGGHLAEAHERIEPEFVGPLLEVHTDPHADQEALERDLTGTLRAAIRAADADDKRLVPLGTPLTEANPPAKGRRGRLFEEIYGDGVISAKNCAGTHVHIEQDDVVDQLNLLTALDPALALVSSSPYYRGRRGEDSSRAAAYRTKSGADFRQYTDLWPYADSEGEWCDRVATAYEEFLALAEDRGVDRGIVEEHFDPEDTVLNPVRRRRRQPTVEWRAPDTALPSQTVRLATDVRDLLERLDGRDLEIGPVGVEDDRIRIPSFSELRDVSRRAIDRGLASDRVRTYLQSFGLDPGSYQPISAQLYGPEQLPESKARRLRLEYARRLRADVETMAADRPDPPDTRNTLQYV